MDQSIQQDFSPLQKTIHKIDFAKDDPTTISSYEVYFSLYQQLSGKSESEDEEENGDETIAKFQALFLPEFFDLRNKLLDFLLSYFALPTLKS